MTLIIFDPPSKRGCFQISNDVDIFINETITKWQSKLELKFSIFWTSDRQFYNEIREKFTGKEKNVDKVAACLGGIHMVFLDTTSHQFSFNELEKSILHELLHLKFPNHSEPQTVKKVKRYLN